MTPSSRVTLREGDLLIATADGEAHGYRYHQGAVGVLCQPPEDTLHICFGPLRLEFSYFSIGKWEVLRASTAPPRRRRA